jgi:hypothetical protein
VPQSAPPPTPPSNAPYAPYPGSATHAHAGSGIGFSGLIQIAAALLVFVSFVLPLLSVTVSSSGYYSSSSSATVSLLDLQRSDWTKWVELDLVVFGGIAAAALGLVRGLDPRRISAVLPLLGYIAFGSGIVWLLSEINSSTSQLTTFYGSGLGVTPGVGLWLGMAVAVVGGLTSLRGSSN